MPQRRNPAPFRSPPGPPAGLGPGSSPRSRPAPAILLAVGLLSVLGSPDALRAQAPPAAPAAAEGVTLPGLLQTLDADLAVVEEKIASLARALPDSAWDWRPAPGVRSSEEVLEHVAYDNFYFPTALGIAPPPATGITDDYETARDWAEEPRDREAVLAALDASFAHLRSALRSPEALPLDAPVTLFGRSMDRRGYWILATTHLHEHLGQLIAYARTRGVVPPWSAGG